MVATKGSAWGEGSGRQTSLNHTAMPVDQRDTHQASSVEVSTMLMEMDEALADEIKATQRSDRSGRVARNGQLLSEIGGQYVYRYELDELWEPADDTPLKLKTLAGGNLRAIVVTASGADLTIATDMRLPNEALTQIRLVDDPAQVLERIREALQSTTEAKTQLGAKTFGHLPASTIPSAVQVAFPAYRPRPSQLAAIQKALANEVTYVIGPPGTGKTSTLAAMACMLAREGRTVLIVAHTNIAVDNAIVKLADMCAAERLPALRDGRILRYGPPQLDSVSQHDDIYPPRIVKRLGHDLESQRALLRTRHTDCLNRLQEVDRRQEHVHSAWEAARSPLTQQVANCQSAWSQTQQTEQHRRASVHADLQQTTTARQQADLRLKNERRALADIVSRQGALVHARVGHLQQVEILAARLAQAQSMSGLGRLVRGMNVERLAQQVADAKQALWDDDRAMENVNREMERAHQSVSDAQQSLHQLDARIEDLTRQLETPSAVALRLAELQRQIRDGEARIADGDDARDAELTSISRERDELKKSADVLDQQIAEIDERLRTIERQLLDNAQVVATTLSKVCMDSHLAERRFDAIIMDEVSMAPLPAVFVAASRANDRVIAFGDPRQLPPIVQAKTAVAKKWLGRDLFEVVGVDLQSAASGDPRSGFLAEQSRMHPSISALARKHVYNGLITDTPQSASDQYSDIQPLPGAHLLLCDTSDGAPVASRPGGSSRVNPYHALCALILARQILESLPQRPADASNTFRIGIVTPYRKQAELIQRLLKRAGLERQVRTGTVHRFQGLEFEAVIFDTVESKPIPHRQEFIGGGVRTPGQRLVNVAVTRAQHKLVVIANARHIDSRFDAADMLKLVVEDAQAAGVINSQVLLAPFAPTRGDSTVRSSESQASSQWTRSAALGSIIQTLEWLDERTFFERFLADVRAAMSEITIFSPFVRSGRTTHVLADLQARCAAGVHVTVVASSSTAGSPPVDPAAKEQLEQVGVTVHTSVGLHEKAVVIDGRVVYFGSLNPLSQNGTSELMQRIESPAFAEEIARMLHVKERTTPAEWGEDVVIAVGELPLGGSCPSCGQSLAPRYGKYGAFYGCKGYPDCKHAQEVSESQLALVTSLAHVTCDKCGNRQMRPRTHRKDMWLECTAPKPCSRRRKVVVQR